MTRRFAIKSIILSLLALVLPVPFIEKLFAAKHRVPVKWVKSFTQPTEIFLHAHAKGDFFIIPDAK
jgi:hypothetical protein|tara:strand:+ start:2832 stop:3029 length:198 start_codon:yes stop_codon:yes gene_type:complete